MISRRNVLKLIALAPGALALPHVIAALPEAADDLQPVSAPVLPFVGVVAGEGAYTHRYADVGSPLVQRIESGTVLRVVDYLPPTRAEDDLGWYQIADMDGQPLGWSQSRVWQPITH